MTEGRQPFTAEIKTLAKGPSTYDPLENAIRRHKPSAMRNSGPSSTAWRRVSRGANTWAGIDFPSGELSKLEDAGAIVYYRHARDGQLLEEGI
jgi:hypothetical protein